MSGTYNNIIYMYNYKWTSKCLTVVLKYSLYCVKINVWFYFSNMISKHSLNINSCMF